MSLKIDKAFLKAKVIYLYFSCPRDCLGSLCDDLTFFKLFVFQNSSPHGATAILEKRFYHFSHRRKID